MFLPKNKKEAPKSWYFPKATHLAGDGPGIPPQTGLTLQPAVILSSWPWCVIHVNNYNVSQKEISSMRGPDKTSWEFKGGGSGLWTRATGKACDKVILFFWTCAPEDAREGGGGLDSWRWNVKSQSVLKENTRRPPWVWVCVYMCAL